MRIKQFVRSYPTRDACTVAADISPRSEDFSVSVSLNWQIDTAVDTDRSRSHRSFLTFELIVVKCPLQCC